MKSKIRNKFTVGGIIATGIITFSFMSCVSDKKQAEGIVPPYPIEKGISAPFAGFIDDNLYVGGGCNFPNEPAAEGGKKVYYPNVFTLNTHNSSAWESAKDLPFPIAYGATVETDKGLVHIGGMNDSTSFKEVMILGRGHTPETGKWQYLPSLPEAIDNASATSIGHTLYVTGGNQGNGGNALYALNLDSDSTWTRLADYPGPRRIQPVLLASENELYLFGGFEVKTTLDEQTGETQKEGIISSDFMIYQVKDNSWSQPHHVPAMKDGKKRALVGCSGTRVGNLLILAGGVNYSIFKSAIEGKSPADYMKRPADWYQFSKDVLIYDLKTKDWSVISEVDGFNKAGGSLLYHKGDLYMVCGETKPGIRTNEIIKKNLKGLLAGKQALPLK